MIWSPKKSDEALPDIILSGERIYLSPPKLEDWQEWADIRRKNQMRLKPFEPTWPPRCLSHDFFVKRLNRQIHDWNTDRAQSFLIFDAPSAKLIGGININQINRGAAQNASLGYWIDGDHEGQGLMRETIQTILHYCFTNLQLHRVHASCILENDSSRNVLIKCGFTEEGLAKKYLKIDGRWQDHYLFGICKEDFST